MHISITKEQLVNFVLNDVNKEERKKIIEAIDTKPEIKERYLFEKRIHDVERYINNEMNIGECCEIEELIKTDSRLYDYFESNTEAKEEETKEEEQDASINVEHLGIIKEQLVNFILNNDKEEYIGQYEQISESINTNPVIKDIYLSEKRKYDVERYINNEMDFGERCEMEELLKINLSLYEYFELKKDLIEEQQNILIDLMYPSIKRVQLVNFVFNDVTEEERRKIIEVINTNRKIKERYLYEKRKRDVERYIDDEMDFGERCEFEQLLKKDSRLFIYFELNNGVIDEEQDVSINHKHIDITTEQLVKFVLNDVSDKEYKKISEAINTTTETKHRYLNVKRRYDVDRYLDNKMHFGERCEIEEILRTNIRLFDYYEEKLNESVNGKQISITKLQLINFILNDVSNEERKKISEAINTNPEIKERYLFEKRIYDVGRYLDNKMDFGERCEIEELIKKDSRLYTHFKVNNGVFKDEQDVTNLKQITIAKEQLINFVLNDVNEKEYKKIIEAINTNPEIKERYLFEKRKHDVERYINDEMTIGERCEMEHHLKMDSRLFIYFELKKDANKEEQNISINLMNTYITKAQLVKFIFNNVTEEEREKIIEAINTNPEIKERYLFEKRKFDVERYFYDEIDIGERCEIEELLKKDSRLSEHFKLKIERINKEEQNVSISGKQIDITKAQLVNFVLNNVNEEEHKKISEAINTNPEIKERYLFEKRKRDVERYLEGEMDFGERCEIEELLETNSRLLAHFELNKDICEFLLTTFKEQINNVHDELYGAINNNESGKIKDEVSSVKDTAPVIELKLNVRTIGKWVAAASIIFMIGFGSRNIYLNNTGSLENRLYNKYYEPFNNDDNQYYSNSVLFDAKKRYSNKEYDLVLSLLDDFSNSVTIEFEKVLYQALALMELKRYDEAIEKLKQTENINKYKLTQSVNNWYLSLCYLKTGKKELAIEQLEKITDFKESPNFYNEANELLKKLNK